MSKDVYIMYETSCVRNVIQFEVDTKQKEKLADFVRETIRDKNLSYRKVAANSGGLITHSTVSDVIAKRGTLTIDSLKGLAKGLAVSEELLFAIARGVPPSVEKLSNERFNNILKGFVDLSDQERKNIEPLLIALETSVQSYISVKKPKPKQAKKVLIVRETEAKK